MKHQHGLSVALSGQEGGNPLEGGGGLGGQEM